MSYKVLIVDDSRLARMAVAKVLGRLRPDWQRVEATNADEALVLLDQASFDVALLDFNMPGRDGLSLAGELRRLRPEMLPIEVWTPDGSHLIFHEHRPDRDLCKS